MRTNDTVRTNFTQPNNRKGAAAVECAIVAPLLTLLVLGAVDLGQFANVHQMVSDASREGARVAAQYDTILVSEVKAAVLQYLEDAFPNTDASTIASATQVITTTGTGGAITSGDLTTVGTGAEVVVQVSVSYDSLRWIQGLPGIAGQQIVARTVMRRE